MVSATFSEQCFSYFWNTMAESAAAELCFAVHPQAWAAFSAEPGSGSKEAFRCNEGVPEDASCAAGRQTSGLASAGSSERFPGELRVIWVLETILSRAKKGIAPDLPSPVNNTLVSGS